jgi:hypothetical protein
VSPHAGFFSPALALQNRFQAESSFALAISPTKPLCLKKKVPDALSAFTIV